MIASIILNFSFKALKMQKVPLVVKEADIPLGARLDSG